MLTTLCESLLFYKKYQTHFYIIKRCLLNNKEKIDNKPKCNYYKKYYVMADKAHDTDKLMLYTNQLFLM